MRSLPHQPTKHGAIDHGDASDAVFLQLQGCYGRSSTSSSACGRLLVLDESFSRMISSILSRSNLSALWTTSRVYGSVSSEWRRPPRLRVGSSSCSRKRGRTDERMGWDDRPGPTWTLFGRPFLRVGPLVTLDLICVG
jgi:hypothetical protein